MKLLLCKSIVKLGIVGDIIDVAPGYGRNYLVPQGLATEPTPANMRALAEARRNAEEERVQQQAQLKQLAARIDGVEVTIRSKANETGHLYGSVGPREIVAALAEEQYYIEPEQVVLPDPIRQLDNVAVEVRFGEDLTSTIKVWVVRDKTEPGDDEDEGPSQGATSGMEADTHGDSPGQ